ncbi:acetylcholine receptor subunit alpha-like isoform X2 [Rhynchophorus ferrugineus]|uniref:acetylcholine receptor subunit alpha-like isoform X2 n=1 Tax=Rhynchophorus ferrugineus TaxID=354439 RepID=UPI003FCC7441
MMMKCQFEILCVAVFFVLGCVGNPDAKRLYDDLLSNYNKLVRPVVNVTDALSVKIKLKLSQLIDVNLKNQIMTTNVWVEQSWYDYKLQWNPKEYGGVEMLHVPSDHIWRPDIVLYNNADGNFEVTLATKATLNFTGRVEWRPPAIYKSSCEIDVEYFPFDEQTCVMKFGSWTYDGFQVDLRHVDELKGSKTVDIGIDLTEFYTSVEWDILEVPAVRNEKFYTCCDEPYLDITFNITMRRKTLFYTVNLIIPCMGISFLTVLVFYLPSDSGEKVSLSISILLSLTVFFLLLAEIIPPTSLVVPLLGKFVLFTMILDTFSFNPNQRIMVRTCKGLELRDATMHADSGILDENSEEIMPNANSREQLAPRELEVGELSSCQIHGSTPPSGMEYSLDEEYGSIHDPFASDLLMWHHCPEVHKAIDGIRFIADHTRKEEDSTKVKEDWKYVAMVLDRLFLWIFTLAVFVGTAGIILQAPTLYDDRKPIDVRISEIATTAKPYISSTI